MMKMILVPRNIRQVSTGTSAHGGDQIHDIIGLGDPVAFLQAPGYKLVRHIVKYSAQVFRAYYFLCPLPY